MYCYFVYTSVIGGKEADHDERDEILAWLEVEQEWEETAKMKSARYYHAVTTIQMDDQAMRHCG